MAGLTPCRVPDPCANVRRYTHPMSDAQITIATEAAWPVGPSSLAPHRSRSRSLSRSLKSSSLSFPNHERTRKRTSTRTSSDPRLRHPVGPGLPSSPCGLRRRNVRPLIVGRLSCRRHPAKTLQIGVCKPDALSCPNRAPSTLSRSLGILRERERLQPLASLCLETGRDRVAALPKYHDVRSVTEARWPSKSRQSR